MVVRLPNTVSDTLQRERRTVAGDAPDEVMHVLEATLFRARRLHCVANPARASVRLEICLR